VNDPAAVVSDLENAPRIVIPLVAEVPAEVLRRRPAPGKWSAHEHACHIAALNAIVRGRLERMLAEENPPLSAYEPDKEDLLGVDLGEAMERFERERAELVLRLRGLSAAEWERTGEHPIYGRWSVFTMLRRLALHDLFHAYRIEELREKRGWLEVPLATAAALAGLGASLQPGEIKVIGPVEVPGLAPRRIRVYLPKGSPAGSPRLGLFLFDGQNVFDDGPSFSGGWHVHETVEHVARRRRPDAPPLPVVVGIDHGNEKRIHELSPFPYGGEPGALDLLLAWMTGILMPELRRELGIVEGPVGVVVGGSSMGGLASLYAHFRHPEAFGGALAMSPSVWVAEHAILEWIAAQPAPPVSRIYLDCGAREGKGMLLPLVARLAAELAERGYETDRLMWRPDPRGGHNEASWRRRLPKAIRFIYR
jgi:enterochelin esterase-like enzyme